MPNDDTYQLRRSFGFVGNHNLGNEVLALVADRTCSSTEKSFSDLCVLQRQVDNHSQSLDETCDIFNHQNHQNHQNYQNYHNQTSYCNDYSVQLNPSHSIVDPDFSLSSECCPQFLDPWNQINQGNDYEVLSLSGQSSFSDAAPNVSAIVSARPRPATIFPKEEWINNQRLELNAQVDGYNYYTSKIPLQQGDLELERLDAQLNPGLSTPQSTWHGYVPNSTLLSQDHGITSYCYDTIAVNCRDYRDQAQSRISPEPPWQSQNIFSSTGTSPDALMQSSVLAPPSSNLRVSRNISAWPEYKPVPERVEEWSLTTVKPEFLNLEVKEQQWRSNNYRHGRSFPEILPPPPIPATISSSESRNKFESSFTRHDLRVKGTSNEQYRNKIISSSEVSSKHQTLPKIGSTPSTPHVSSSLSSTGKTSHLKRRLAQVDKSGSYVIRSRRNAKDDFLIQKKRAGFTYKQIKREGGYTEAESTLRGRFRTLTKAKSARVRKPEWSEKDIKLLKEAVAKLAPWENRNKVPWKKVAEYILNNGGSYHFGNSTCRKRWDELQRQKPR